jgi:hypothetical protein
MVAPAELQLDRGRARTPGGSSVHDIRQDATTGWLTAAEVADRFHVGRRRIYQLITRGLPAVMVISDRKPYRSWMLPAEGCSEWLDRSAVDRAAIPPRQGPPQFVVTTHSLVRIDPYGPLAEQLAAALTGA